MNSPFVDANLEIAIMYINSLFNFMGKSVYLYSAGIIAPRINAALKAIATQAKILTLF